MRLTSDLIDSKKELPLSHEGPPEVHVCRYYLQVIVASLPHELLRRLALHLLLDRVPRLIIEQAV